MSNSKKSRFITKDDRVIFIGGPGSGGGGVIGGKAPYYVVGKVDKEVIDKLMAKYKEIPEWAREGVQEVVFHEKPGFGFEAGGVEFRAGASWDVSNGRINVYNAKNYADSGNDPFGHEVGHNMFDRWWNQAREQENRVYNSTDTMHMFMLNGYPKPEFVNEVARLMPLATARDNFTAAWRAGQDGITHYSMAWAKEGHWSETAAEMAKVYFRGGENALRSVAKGTGASDLAESFLQMTAYFESSYD